MEKKTSQKCSKGNTEPLSKSDLRDRAFAFTSFEEKEPPFDKNKFKYLCYSPEICPETKRHHWQGYCYLNNQMTISALQKYFQKNYGWQFGKLFVAEGTAEQNRIYCGYADYVKGDKIKKKNEAFKEFGIMPNQGKRTDLDEIKEKLTSGTKLDDIILDNPMLYHQYGRTLTKLESILLKKKWRKWMTEGIWYYGETGTGKSHTAFENFNPDTHYVLNQHDGGFWQGYTGQEIVIINEFRGEIKFSELLDIVDKHPKNVKVKGGDTYPLLAKKVIITSCKPPKEIYKQSLDDAERFDQLERRFKVIHLTEKYIEEKKD